MEKVWKEASYVHVTWGWIAFLIVKLVLAAGFLTITIVGLGSVPNDSESDTEPEAAPPDIKDSSLTTLAALSQECRMLLGDGLGPMDELAAVHKGLRVRLEKSEIVPAERNGDLVQDLYEDGVAQG